MEERWNFRLLLLLLSVGPVWPLDYNITTTWNGGAVTHDPVQLSLSVSPNGEFLELSIIAQFFNDPPSPPAPPGDPFFGLWDYEVVEAFFLNDQDQYVEVEVCPWGQHLVLLLNGQRLTIRHSLPLEVTTHTAGKVWTGLAKIPVSYLPPKVTKFNAYAIHGSGSARVYESLYPAPATALNPDFHALQYFRPIDMSALLPGQADQPMSELWNDAVDGIFRYRIRTSWNGQPLDTNPVEITLQGFEAGVEMNVTAPFYNDPAPPGGEPGQPFYGLWDYEVAEMFFLNDQEEYLEVELGAWGQHLLLLLKGERNTIKHSLDLDYFAERTSEPVGNTPGQWKGSAMIPPGYFPPNVTRMNAYAIHGVDDKRQYQALYPAPYNDVDYLQPDFHRLNLFRPIDFEYQVKDNSQYSDVWQEAINSSSSTVSPQSETAEEVEAVTVLGLLDTTLEPTPAPTAPPKPLHDRPRGQVTFMRKRPQPQKVVSMVFRGQRREEEVPGSLPVRRVSRPVPNPQLVAPRHDQFQRRRLPDPEEANPVQTIEEKGQQLSGQSPQKQLGQTVEDPILSLQDKQDGGQKIPQEDSKFQEQTFSQQTPQDQRLPQEDFQAQNQGHHEPHLQNEDQRLPQENVQVQDQGHHEPHLQNEDQRLPQENVQVQDQGPHEPHFQSEDQLHPQENVQVQDQGHHEPHFQNEDQRLPQENLQVQDQGPHEPHFQDDQRLPQENVQVQDQEHNQPHLQNEDQPQSHTQVDDQSPQQSPPQFQDQPDHQEKPGFQNEDQPQGVSFQEQSVSPEDPQFQDQTLPHKGTDFQDERRPEERQQFQDQRFQQEGQQFQGQIFQQDQRVQDQRFQQQGHPTQDQRFQQPNHQFKDQRFQLPNHQPQDQKFQQPNHQLQDQRFQRPNLQPQDQRFQQPNHQPQDQRFQPPNLQPQDQRFKQPNHQSQDQRFQQPNHQLQDQRFQRPNHQSQDQRFQRPNHQTQDQGFQQPNHQSQDPRFQQPNHQSQDQRFQQNSANVLGSESSPPTAPGVGTGGREEETAAAAAAAPPPEVEAAVVSLSQETPALPPPHPICFEPGLVPDRNRCYVFHECVLEDGAWQMYSWKCRRGHVFDAVNIACVRGRCRRGGGRLTL